MKRTVLITGSSSGIGRATAQLFAARGWNVVATARNPAALAALAEKENVAALSLDVTNEASMAAAVAAAIERFDSIDVLVNNAGYGLFGPLEGTTTEQWEAQFRTNVLGTVAMVRHVVPVMRQRGGGTIVNISSMAGRFANPFMSAYHASKYAIEGFSESLRFELKLHGIRLKLIEPGHFKSDFLTRSLEKTGHPAYDRQFDNFMAWAMREDEKAPGCEAVAEVIFKAATDKSDRLRYPVQGRLALLMYALLPDAVWRSLMAGGMTRRPKERPPIPAKDQG
jgi:NAD(P)-dependent dehydrogenase (short-subunit alcohol dehydrogenase family)